MTRQGQKQRLIRVIVACEDDGFEVERGMLAQNVYPRLRLYCMATHGLEFQIIDFNGSSPGQGDEGSSYLEQLYICHEQAIGPGMIAFIDGHDSPVTSPRDSAFHQVLDQAYFNYAPTKRNQKCLFIIRRQVESKAMHEKKVKYLREPLPPVAKSMRERVAELATRENLLSFVLHTSGDEKMDMNQSHYLNEFCDSVFKRMSHLIDENVNDFTNSHPESSLKPEMTQHWDYAQELSMIFARESVEASIKKYIEGDSDQMCIVHGPDDMDVSSVIAKLALDIRDHSVSHGHKVMTSVVLRHIGLTPGTDHKIQLLRSICQQLQVLKQDPMTSEQIELQFHKIVHDGEYQGNLVIFLDLVHLLDDVTWLPKRLASNVRLIISLRSNSSAMDIIKRKCYDVEQYVNVPRFTLAAHLELISMMHRTRYQQRLNQQNIAQFAEVLQPCDRTGYHTGNVVRLAEQQRIPLIKAFKSFPTVDAYIDNQLCYVSMNYPSQLLQKALSYLAISANGLSQLEMEDVLSLDNEVMKENTGTVTNRIPSRMVCTLLKDLQKLLVRLQFYGIEVYRFRDPIIRDYVLREYAGNSELRKSLHSHLADYYLGTWHDRPKAFCDERYSKRLVLVPEQILVHNPETKFPVYNKRKLTLMPHHLAESDRTAELKSLVLYNFEWILTKIRALGIPDLVGDYDLSTFAEAGIVATALRESEAVLGVDDSVLGVELAGRLLPYYSEHAEIKYLVDQCDEHSTHNGGLIPRLPLFVPPDTVLEKCTQIPYGPKYEHILFKNNNIQVLSTRKGVGHISVYDLELSEPVCEVCVQDVYKSFLTPDGKYMIHFTKSRKVLMHSTETGDLCMERPYQGDLVYKTAITGQYLAFTMEKSAGPHILDLSQSSFIHRLNLQCRLVAMSRLGEYLICDGSHRLNIYTLPLVRRLCTLDFKDPLSVVFAPSQGPTPKGPDFYIVTKNYDLYHVTIDLICVIATTKKIFRDVEMREMLYSPDDEKYLIHCTRMIHVFNRLDQQLFSVRSRLPLDGNLTFDMALFTDDSHALITIQDVHISVWDEDGKLVRVLVNPNQQNITHAIIKDKDLFTLDIDFASTRWDLKRTKNGTKPKANIHSGSVDRIVIIDSTTVACYGDDTPEVTLFNLDTGRKLRTLVPRNDSTCVIVHVCGSKNGEYVLTVAATAEAVFPTSDVVCDAYLWRIANGECLLHVQGTEYAGFSPTSVLVPFVRFTSEVGRDCLVYDIKTQQEKTIPLPPLTILAKPIVDSRSNLRLFTSDMDGVDLLLWRISLDNESDYMSIYFTETYMINDIRCTGNADVINILHTGGLITYDLALHQIMRKITFPSSPQTIYNSQYTMALDGRRLHDLNNARNERLLRMRAAPNMVTFILRDHFLAYVSEEYDRLIIKGVKDGRRRAWCPLHGRGTSITVAQDDRTVLVGCEDGQILTLTLVLDAKDARMVVARMPSRVQSRPKTAQQVLTDDIERVVLDSATRRVMSATIRPSRPGSTMPRPFTTLRCRPTSSPAIRLMDRPYTR